jgi:hypothetical protein
MMKKRLRIVLLFIVLVGAVFALSKYINRDGRFKTISSDGEGYYQYLPAVFIKKDITAQPYSYWLEDGRLFNKYTCGVALLELPFFIVAHAYTRLTDPVNANGYTENYADAIMLSAAFYMVLGMFLLYRFLRRYFPEFACIVTLVCIYAGTNMFYYVHGESGMSHVYSFFLYGTFVHFTPYFLEFRKLKYTLIIAIVLGISVLLRPTNIIISLFILFYAVYSTKALRERIMLLLRNYKSLLLIMAACIIVYIPQMYYWHTMFGKLFVNSYKYDIAVTGFINWRSPKILEVLFGHRSGWLLYTPIMLLAVIGMIRMAIKRSHHAIGILFIFLVMLYLGASWSAYTFGWAYGYRPFIELYAFLAIPFAYMVSLAFNGKSLVLKALVAVFILNGLFVNRRLFEIYSGWDGPEWTWERTKDVFRHAYFLDR